jgi:hypothetical protein
LLAERTNDVAYLGARHSPDFHSQPPERRRRPTNGLSKQRKEPTARPGTASQFRFGSQD